MPEGKAGESQCCSFTYEMRTTASRLTENLTQRCEAGTASDKNSGLRNQSVSLHPNLQDYLLPELPRSTPPPCQGVCVKYFELLRLRPIATRIKFIYN